jgi:Ca-activated chloride channel family protein
MIEFIWPTLLWLLILVPAAIFVYVRLLRRAAARAIVFPDLGVVAAAAAEAPRWRRHLAAAALLVGFALALVALSRPVFPIPAPADRSAIMLVIDVSGSMRSTDIDPNRIEAAKAAAKAFLEDLPKQVRVGLVTFAGYAQVVAPPGTDHNVIAERLDEIRLLPRTAIGEGLLEAMAALPGRVRPTYDGTLPQAPPDDLPPAIVILLSDGRSNTGINSVTAAEIARRQNVTVHTIGVGNPNPSPGSWVIGGAMDESELQAVAQAGGGTYHQASSAMALKGVYRKLARAVGWERRPDEVSAVFALAGATAVGVAVTLSRWVTHPLGF